MAKKSRFVRFAGLTLNLPKVNTNKEWIKRRDNVTKGLYGVKYNELNVVQKVEFFVFDLIS